MRSKDSTSSDIGSRQRISTSTRQPSVLALCIALAFGAGAPLAHAAQADTPAVPNQRAAAHWQDLVLPAQASSVAKSKTGAAASTDKAGGGARTPALRLKRLRGAALDLSGLRAHAAGAPSERSARAMSSPLTISLPHPDGGYQRFTLVESSIMEPELAAKHPEIKTYKGQGIDDPSATLRMDVTPLGLHASVRSPRGGFYVDPYYQGDDTVYASYSRADLVKERAPLIEGDTGEAQLSLSRSFYKEGDTVEVNGSGFTPGARVELILRGEGDSAVLQTVSTTADQNGAITAVVQPGRTGSYEVSARDGAAISAAAFQVLDPSASATAVAGGQLRTYRLALVTDPSYASYFGAANVTAAKVTLINRVTQVYEDETSIRLVLIGATDKLNLNTAADMTGANGPCGGSACYTASQASTCGSGTLTRNRVVAGLLAGAGNFDVGHIALGLDGGGIASLGVVGLDRKAQGCTGLPEPVGDFFAVDYVAHELGHQFSGNHTFNGVLGACGGSNRNPGTSVENGSGSSIMAYAGICSTDNLQNHSDPYWSQRSFDEIVAHTSGLETNLNEVQMAALKGFSANGMQFRIGYNGNLSAPIVRGTNFTAAGIKAAIEGITGWPAGATVSASTVGDTAFTLTFGGTLAAQDVPNLTLEGCSTGCSGYINDITAGGSTTRRGTVSANGNNAPMVTTQPQFTIPVRTPFALTGSATDIDGDPLTYMWEQNDRGAATGTGLVNNAKTNGPLFRQFGTRALVSSTDTLQYSSPNENHTTGDPTRIFPDMAQILANNTNAETGACPTASATPTGAQIDCFSEYLPTAAYVGFTGVNAAPASLNFKLTARDGRGGLNNAVTQLVLAPTAGPFLVTSPNTAVTLAANSAQTVTWSVANTDIAPVSTANVKITLSADGGKTWPYVLAASVPNNGSASVTLPSLGTTTARIKVEAIGNVFFDVSNADFAIKLTGDVNGDGTVGCADLAIVKASMGKRTGQTGFDARADVTGDGLVDSRDLAYVSQRLPKGTVCN